MHAHSIEHWQHRHAFLGARHDRHERRTWLVVALTAVMMVAEIAGGSIFGSMALVADGWHMSTHAAALSIAGFAYWFARKHAHDPRFTFGTGKLGELAGFASAIILGLVALFIGYESELRILAPITISFNEAIAIAVAGLGVNIFSAFLLREDHDHHEHQGHAHHGHHDTNIRAAYARPCRRADLRLGNRHPVGRATLRLDVDGPCSRNDRYGGDRILVGGPHPLVRHDAARHGA
jgi:Co/Zn/Cd efflux system component